MKKLLTYLTSFIAVLACCFAVACGNKEGGKSVKPVVIEATSTAFDYDGKTLKDYMEFMQGTGGIEFAIEGGMVTSINGTANTTNSYWMLYTSDTENANTAWGTIEYGGETYGSAALGADSLAVKQGCLYIWAYQTF